MRTIITYVYMLLLPVTVFGGDPSEKPPKVPSSRIFTNTSGVKWSGPIQSKSYTNPNGSAETPFQEMQVNENFGKNYHYSPNGTALNDSIYVVVWYDGRNAFADVYAQKARFSGEPIGGNVLISENDNLSDIYPSATALSDGSILIAWSHNRIDGKYDIYIKHVDSSLNQLGQIVVANPSPLLTAPWPIEIESFLNDNYIVTWDAVDNGEYGIFATTFTAQHIKFGTGGIRLDNTAAESTDPFVARISNDRAIVVWQDKRNGDYDLYGQIIDDNGTLIDSNLALLVKPGSDQYSYDIDFDDVGGINLPQGIIITWSENIGGIHSFLFRKYNTAGEPISDPITIDSGSKSAFGLHTGVSGNGFIGFTWYDNRTGSFDIYFSVFEDSTEVFPGNVLVNSVATGDQRFPGLIAGLYDFVIAWSDKRDGYFDLYYKGFAYNLVTRFDEAIVSDDQGSSSQFWPVIAKINDGTKIIFWHDLRSGIREVYMQFFDNNDSKVGANIKISGNATTSIFPSVATLDNDTSIVVWENPGVLMGQLISPTGQLVGGNIAIHGIANNFGVKPPDITALPDAMFGLVWEEVSLEYDIFFMRSSIYSIDVNNYQIVNDDNLASVTQSDPKIDATSDSGVVIVWTDLRNGIEDIYFQKYDMDATPIGNNTKIFDDGTNATKSDPEISGLSDGRFLIVWVDDRSGIEEVYAQMFDSNLQANGTNIKVSEVGEADKPQVIDTPDDGFVIAWINHQYNYWGELYGQQFDSLGNKVGSNFKITSEADTSYQLFFNIASDKNELVTAWQSNKIEGQAWDIFTNTLKLNIADIFPPEVPNISIGTFNILTPYLWWNESSEIDLSHFAIYQGVLANFDTTGMRVGVVAKLDTTFIPTGLIDSTTYFFKIVAIDSSGNISTLSNEVSFLYESIFSVLAVSPTQNALNVPLGATVSVTFGVDINPATITANTLVVHGGYTGKLSGNYTYDSGTKTATFTPDNPFKVGEQVGVTLTTGIASAAGDTLVAPFTWDFTSEVLGGSGNYAAAVNYSAGSGPWSVTSADLDGDGDADLAVANHDNNTISVMLNIGDGSFAAAVNYGVGSFPLSVTAADMDGDGDADLAVVNSGSNNVSVLLNSGFGLFTAAVYYGVGTDPRSVTTTDLNGDGDVDLAVANYNSSTVSVLLGNGDGTFAAAEIYGVGSFPHSITAADMDGDGDADLAVAIANTSGDSVQVLLNNGSGVFPAAVSYSLGVGSEPRSVTASDLDGDGDIDLAVANSSSDNVSVLLGNGDGTFAAKTDYLVGSQPFFVTAADLDGDGDADLVVTISGSNNVSVLLNSGGSLFSAAVNYSVGINPWSVTTADLDGDGDVDLVVASFSSNIVSVLLNLGSYSARLSSLGAELSGDIPLDYHVSQPSGTPTNLKVEYSINQGAAWALPTIVGDTTALGPINYDGTIIWQSEDNLPGVDLPGVQLRITPYTADTTGRSYATAPFRLDNNHEPVAELGAVSGEKVGNVALTYTLTDDESDTLSWVAEYSKDRGATWQAATVSGNRTGLLPANYSGNLTWDTVTDLPGWEDSLTWFRIIPSDYEAGTAATLVIHIDNNEPPVLTITSGSIDSVVSRVALDYLLTDAENDTLSIQADYSLDQGISWIPSFVSSESRAIPPNQYSGSVEWVAYPSLVGTTDDVMLRLFPADYDPGIGDTLTGLTVIYHPGDYTGDLLISTDDLVQFAAAWNAEPQNVAYEIGPASGTVPELVPEPDGVLDFEDLVVFVQMWNWSFSNSGFAKSIPALAKTTSTEPSLRLIQVVPEKLWEWDGRTVIRLEGTVPEDLMMIEGLLSVNGSTVRLKQFAEGGRLAARWQSVPLFMRTSGDSSQTIIALAGLGIRDDVADGEDLPLLTFEADLAGKGTKTITLDYTLWDRKGLSLEAGAITLAVENLLPTRYALHQNYPNPFNPTTTIRYELPKASNVQLRIYNLLGQEVIRLVDEDQTPGYHKATWEGRDARGRSVSSGIYIARLVAPGYMKSVKMVLLK